MSASPLHVGLNLVYLVPGETGGLEIYARELIPRLAARPGLRLTLFINRVAGADRGGPWGGGDVPAVVVPVDPRRRIEWVRGEQALLPGRAERAGVQVLHSLASTGPARGSFRRVVTIHDLIYAVHPEAHFGVRALGMRVLVPLAARRSQRVIAPSAATAADVERVLGVPRSRVDVVPNGLGATSDVTPAPEGEVRRRLDLGSRPLLLSVSAKRPHKNLPTLLDALARMPREGRPVLVVPGYPTPHEAELRARARKLGVEPDVRLLGWVSDAFLEGLYATAAAFVFPSLYEGFGLPVLEAMARGVPVACSDRSSLPEVGGDAAVYFDPSDPAAIAAAVAGLLEDPVAAAGLREAARARAAGFTWERSAQLTEVAYRRALEMPR